MTTSQNFSYEHNGTMKRADTPGGGVANKPHPPIPIGPRPRLVQMHLNNRSHTTHWHTRRCMWHGLVRISNCETCTCHGILTLLQAVIYARKHTHTDTHRHTHTHTHACMHARTHTHSSLHHPQHSLGDRSKPKQHNTHTHTHTHACMHAHTHTQLITPPPALSR